MSVTTIETSAAQVTKASTARRRRSKRHSFIEETKPDGVPPLEWWRGGQSPQLDSAAVDELRAVLSKLHLFAYPTWPDAVTGDAAAAVRIGIMVGSSIESRTPIIDCAGSALLLCAAEGSVASAEVLQHFRKTYVVPARCRPEWRA